MMQLVPSRFCAEHRETPFALARSGGVTFRVCTECVSGTPYADALLPRQGNEAAYDAQEAEIAADVAALPRHVPTLKEITGAPTLETIMAEIAKINARLDEQDEKIIRAARHGERRYK